MLRSYFRHRVIKNISRLAVFTAVLAAAVFIHPVFGQNTLTAPAASQKKLADVRLVIDVSGSMKRNDPANLRQPSVDLLVQLLPEGSKAGVWTFGKWVNMLVPHRVVDNEWRNSAGMLSKNINSVGLFTNIGEALEKAAYDADTLTDEYRTSIILLTDGMVDIDKSPEANQKEWRRIVDEVLPALKQAGYIIHTIALSDNADKNLMSKLSLATDGIAEVARSPEELMSIFLKAFDVAAPSEQVPLTDNQFVIDSSVEEFTALIFRENPKEQTELLGPDEQLYSATNTGADVKWHRASNYDLITVKQPLEGSWGVKASMAPDSRVTVVSNLNLLVNPLPNNIYKGQEETATLRLQEDGKTIVRQDFLDLMTITATMEAGNDEFSLRQFWQQPISSPEAGLYTKVLPVFDKDGIYQLSVVVDGKTFVRQFNHQFVVRQPFGVEVKPVFKDGKVEYHIIANAYSANIDVKNTQVVATVEAPGRRKKIRPLEPTAVDTWQATLLPDKEGEYRATVKAKGFSQDGAAFEVSLEPITFQYSLEAGFAEQEEPFFEPTPTPEPTPEPADTKADAVPSDNEGSEPPRIERPVPAWIMYAILGVGNLVIFLGGFLLFRKVMGKDDKDDILEQFSDEKIEEPAPAEAEKDESVEAEPEVDDEEEPPMEDLDTSSDDDIPASEIDDNDDLDPGSDLDPEPDLNESNSGDEDFDDLEAMAMAQEALAEEGEVEAPAGDDDGIPEPEDDDMVTEMLKAQGLDLAEEELDDAISSLIDDLDSDEDEDDMLDDFK